MPAARLPAARHTVYNLGVAAPHTYFANDILVHNKDRGYHAPLDDAWFFMWKGLDLPDIDER